MTRSKIVKGLSVIIATLSTMSMVSCIESDFEETFEVSLTGYILQEKDLSKNIFTPYMFISSNSSTFELADVSLYGSNNNVFEFQKLNEYVYRTSGLDQLDSLTTLNGNYTFTGKAKTGEEATGTLELSFTPADTLGDLNVISIERTATSLRATVKEVKNGVNYGFIISPYSTSNVPSRWNNHYKVVVQNPSYINNGEFTFQMNFSKNDIATEKARIQVFVSNHKSVYIESKEAKTYNAETDTFE